MRLFHVLAASILPISAWQASAEPTPPSFAAGFEKLNALGPDQPAKDTPWRLVTEESRNSIELLNEVFAKMQGNGWLIATKDDGKIQIIPFGQVLPIVTDPPGAEKAEGGGLLGKILGANQKQPAESFPDLKKDVKKITASIAKLEAFDSPEDFTRSWNGNGASAFGPLLVFAAQLHQTGHPELADELAWALFTAAPSRESVVNAALDHLGNQLLQQTTTRFFEDWNWQAYHDGLETLVGKFPRGWQAQPAAALVVDSLKLRISGNPPPDPRASGIKLDDKALDAITWMLELPEADDSSPKIPDEIAARLQRIPPEYHAQYLESMGLTGGSQRIIAHNLWLLKKPEELKSLTDSTSPLIKLGTGALPVLAALASDNYPTPYRTSRSSSFSYSSDESSFERAMAIHASMERPSTRGDIARLILLATLPDSNGDLNSIDTDSLKQIAMDFHEAHHGKDWGELAGIFLAEGSAYQKAEAAKLLATSAETKNHELFEKFILESSPAVASIASVTIYAQQRKLAAKPFIETYIALVREEIGDGSDLQNFRELPWELRQPGSLKQTINQLEAMVTGKSPQALAREIAKSPPEEARIAIPTFFKNLSTEKPRNQMAAMLAGAVTAEDPANRALFLIMTFQVGWIRDEDNQSSARKFSESEAAAWKKLIADERPVPDGSMDSYSNFGTTLGELAACATEYALAPSEFNEVRTASEILKDSSFAALCLIRSKARLSNEPIPPLPNPENVPAERLKEIVTAAGTKSAMEITAYLDSLGPDERAAWYAWMYEDDPKEPPVPESIRKLGMTIVTEDNSPQSGMKSEPGLLGLKAGFEIHEDNLDAYLAELASDPKKHSLCFGSLSNASFPPGLTAWTGRSTIDELDEIDEFGGDSEAVYFFSSAAQIFQQDEVPEKADALILVSMNSTTLWWVIDGKPVLSKIDEDGDVVENPESTLPAEIAGAREAGEEIYMRFMVISRADAERLAALEDQDN